MKQPSVVLCPKCGKLVALKFPIHDCRPRKLGRKRKGRK